MVVRFRDTDPRPRTCASCGAPTGHPPLALCGTPSLHTAIPRPS